MADLHVVGRFDELDAGPIEDDPFLSSPMWQWAIRPLTTTERSPSEIRKSCSESSCSANGVSICAPPWLMSRMVIGWKTLTSPCSGDGTGTRSLSRLFSSAIRDVARLYTKRSQCRIT